MQDFQVPDRIRALPWVGWRHDYKPDRLKPAKLPINPRTGGAANVADPRTWGDYGSALAAAASFNLDGVGVVLTSETGLTGVDLDDCRDPTTGELDHWAGQILDRLHGTYAELSPSQRGVRSFVEGVLPAGCRNRIGDIEAYSAGRFLTITGSILPDRPLAVTDAGGALDWLVAEHLTPESPSRSTSQPPGSMAATRSSSNGRSPTRRQGRDWRPCSPGRCSTTARNPRPTTNCAESSASGAVAIPFGFKRSCGLRRPIVRNGMNAAARRPGSAARLSRHSPTWQESIPQADPLHQRHQTVKIRVSHPETVLRPGRWICSSPIFEDFASITVGP